MSARPRPVTATFPPPAFAEYQPRSHSYSLSSGSSTASLLSVLDHDSCDSIASDSPDRRVDLKTCQDETQENGSSSSSTKPIRSVSRTKSDHIVRNGAHIRYDRYCSPPLDSGSIGIKSNHASQHVKQASMPAALQQRDNCIDSQDLSAWESWVLRKAIEERDRQQAELRRQEEQQHEAERKRAEKERKKMEAHAKISSWVKEYDAKLKQERKLEKQRIRMEKELKEEEQRMVQLKAVDKYKDWLEKVKREEAERVRLQREKMEKEKHEKEEKQRKNLEAYGKWCEEAKKRPRTAPNSFGYCSGKLKGYYDTSALPTPSFVNPIPWHPIEIPQPKPPVRKKSPKRRWNPDKYL